MVTACSSSIGDFISKVNNGYKKKDEEFANELRKENDMYEDVDNALATPIVDDTVVM